jgi:hypothetical protein
MPQGRRWKSRSTRMAGSALFPSALPPVGLQGIFQLEFVKLYSYDGTEPATFQKDNFDNYKAGALYRIVSTGDGKPTPWEGYEIKEPLYDPFDGWEDTPDGRFPKFRVNANGSRPTSVSRFLVFVNAFFDFERLSNAHVWSDEELVNPLIAVQQYRIPGRRIKAMLEMTDGGKGNKRLKIDLLKVEASMDAVPATETVVSKPAPAQAPAAVQQPAASTGNENLTRLINYLNIQARPAIGEDAFNAAFGLTTKGQEWAKANILTAWSEAGMPAHRKFSLLTEEEADKLYKQFLANEEVPF